MFSIIKFTYYEKEGGCRSSDTVKMSSTVFGKIFSVFFNLQQ